MDSNTCSDESNPSDIERRRVALIERKFDVESLAPNDTDMKRVYKHLEKEYGEDYALQFIFTMRTAIGLHRGWNMPILTNSLLQQIKNEFKLRMTWNISVLRLKFRVEDGRYELHRKVPYDYDSEYQDIYYRIAMALIAREITVHEALWYQNEAQKGNRTAGSGKFLRNFPGRLVVYPLQASMCAVIFFNGKWIDAAISAICGLVAGLVECALSKIGGQAGILLDVLVGISTGIIGGLWYDNVGQCCLPAIFLGTLYWFFYGTAFVIGLLEIMVGELETGVTRFVAVSVKTFILSLGSCIGLMIAVSGGAKEVWVGSSDMCDSNFTKGMWWRIPVYLLCSVGVLGQYRLRIDRYWCALIVQLVAYEVQYEVYNLIGENGKYFTGDHLDTATSNMVGAAAGVISACALAWMINTGQRNYSDQILQNHRSDTHSTLAKLWFKTLGYIVSVYRCLRLNRASESKKKQLKSDIEANPSLQLSESDTDLYLETVVGGQDINIWSILMPAVYQLVPGSVIARFWYQSIFPEEPEASALDFTSQDSVFSNLMVISTSLSLGLIFGFAIVQIYVFILSKFLREKFFNKFGAMYTILTSSDDDPECTPCQGDLT